MSFVDFCYTSLIPCTLHSINMKRVLTFSYVSPLLYYLSLKIEYHSLQTRRNIWINFFFLVFSNIVFMADAATHSLFARPLMGITFNGVTWTLMSHMQCLTIPIWQLTFLNCNAAVTNSLGASEHFPFHTRDCLLGISNCYCLCTTRSHFIWQTNCPSSISPLSAV
jgi:hypothetical protein